MYPGYAKESPLRTLTKILGDASVRDILQQTQLGQVLNRAIGQQDRFYLGIRRLIPQGGKFFSQGWGDVGRIEAFRQEALECVATQQFARDELIIPTKTHVSQTPDYSVTTYRADSPWAHWLPPESKSLFLQIIAPHRTPQAVAFHFPCTGDEGFEYRRDQVAKNLLSRGVASVLPMIPYYGFRRPKGQDRWYVNSVGDFLTQLTVGFMESLSLYRWLRQTFNHLPFVFTGFSLGGAMAASSACALSEGPRVALAPCLSSLTAEAMCDGAISLNIDWQALGGGRSGTPEIRQKLYRLADRFGVQEVMKTNPVNRIGSLHQLIAPEDVIVAPRFGEALFARLEDRIHSQNPHSYAKLEAIAGGHGTALIAAGYSFEPAILRALENLAP